MDVDARAREAARQAASKAINSQTRYAGWGNLDELQRQAAIDAALEPIAALVREAVAEERERCTGARVVTSYPACNSDD